MKKDKHNSIITPHKVLIIYFNSVRNKEIKNFNQKFKWDSFTIQATIEIMFLSYKISSQTHTHTHEPKIHIETNIQATMKIIFSKL